MSDPFGGMRDTVPGKIFLFGLMVYVKVKMGVDKVKRVLKKARIK